MAIVRYGASPMTRLHDEINRVFNAWNDNDTSAATAGWAPTVDIYEVGNEFKLFVDVPGVDPSTVDITLDNGVLTINGERHAPVSDEGEDAVRRRSERGLGRFHRRFILPDTVDAEQVQAAGKHGVLEITIPKQAKAQPRRITVAA